jgi:radical SAM protein with 4Fe4S-binding SPASM domain
VGALILRLRNGGRALEEVAEIISGEYGCSRAEVERDAASFWTDVQASQFLAEPSPQRTYPTRLRLEVPELYVTTRCNRQCSYCAVRGAFPDGDMPTEIFREVVRQSIALDAVRIVITGGEPFLRKDLLDLIRSIEGSIPVKVLTNGTLVDKVKARELARLGVAVQVSLDGGCREVNDLIRGEGSFDLAVRAIRLLRDSGAGLPTMNCTIQKANANDVPRLLDLAEREGIKEVSLTPLVPGVEGEQRFQCADADSILTVKRYLDGYEGPVLTGLSVPGFGVDAVSGFCWCAPGQSPSIGPDGSVFPCTPFARTPFIAGRIPENTLDEVLTSETVGDLNRYWHERADQIEECSACVWKHFCHGGCPAFAYHQHGSLLAKDCFCEVRKQLYSDLFFRGGENGDRRPR